MQLVWQLQNMLASIALKRFRGLVHLFQLGSPAALRADMDRSDCIISGSAALFIFHPTTFIPNDIDFYLPIANAIHFEYALFRRGFTEIVDNSSRVPYRGDSIVTVVRLRKPGMSRTINVITTRDLNPLAAVVEFHSTLVMNAVMADGVVSLYPLLTLAGRGITTTNDASSKRRRHFLTQKFGHFLWQLKRVDTTA
ncbi:hypothetical protein CVT26_000574 [Gymnopilus dilepis]|uniref:Uncharacterized protein n=1 Tax=Gymnopilus dilepis TaxID=231916 RepID=A0A409VH81_9AGAR|nr:hypothetical protein CVT26_000574 [Gymnopilus dilepis]